MASFERFAKLAAAKGLVAVDRGDGHWQVRGSVLVNYYPHGKRGPTIYVNGTVRAFESGDIEAALDIAAKGPARAKLAKRRDMKRERRYLLSRNPFCRWCNAKLDAKTATVDHVVPISRGGSNATSNLVLACFTCNQKRRDGVEPPRAKETTE